MSNTITYFSVIRETEPFNFFTRLKRCFVFSQMILMLWQLRFFIKIANSPGTFPFLIELIEMKMLPSNVVAGGVRRRMLFQVP